MNKIKIFENGNIPMIEKMVNEWISNMENEYGSSFEIVEIEMERAECTTIMIQYILT